MPSIIDTVRGALSSIGKRAAVGGGFLAAGYLGATKIQNIAKEQRAYLGNREFENRYQGGFDVAAGMSKLAGFGGLGVTAIAGTPMEVLRRVTRTSSIFRKGMRSLGKTAAISAFGAGTMYAMTSSPIASIVTGAASMAAPLAYMLRKKKMATGAILGSLGAGMYLGYRIPIYPSAEGNVTDIQENKSSIVRKMNFSTSNLVFALHSNRKA